MSYTEGSSWRERSSRSHRSSRSSGLYHFGKHWTYNAIYSSDFLFVCFRVNQGELDLLDHQEKMEIRLAAWCLYLYRDDEVLMMWSPILGWHWTSWFKGSTWRAWRRSMNSVLDFLLWIVIFDIGWCMVPFFLISGFCWPTRISRNPWSTGSNGKFRLSDWGFID